jgi:hypothetical protein
MGLPLAGLEAQPTFGGRAKARLGEILKLDANRAVTARIKELLGL